MDSFDKLVDTLASLNNLTVPKYKEYVYWCFENKREDREEIEKHRDSLSLWIKYKKNKGE